MNKIVEYRYARFNVKSTYYVYYIKMCKVISILIPFLISIKKL